MAASSLVFSWRREDTDYSSGTSQTLKGGVHPYPCDLLDLAGNPEQQLPEPGRFEGGGRVLDAQNQQEARRQLWFISAGVQSGQNLLQDPVLLLRLVAQQRLRARIVPPAWR